MNKETYTDPALEALLTRRHFEAPSHHFMDRIVNAARKLPQLQPVSITAWLSQLFRECAMPHPAFALAVALMIGFLAGAGDPLQQLMPTAQDSATIPDSLFEEEASL